MAQVPSPYTLLWTGMNSGVNSLNKVYVLREVNSLLNLKTRLLINYG